MQSYSYVQMATLLVFISLGSLCSAAALSILRVKTVNQTINVPFIPHYTTIWRIKQLLQDSEGIPADQQTLTKAEGLMIFTLPPKQLVIVLDDNQTCAYYGLAHNAEVQLYLASPHQPIKAAPGAAAVPNANG